jgi:hypothetical protein
MGGGLTHGRRLGMTLTSGPHLSASETKEKERGCVGPAGKRSWASLGRPVHAGGKRPTA